MNLYKVKITETHEYTVFAEADNDVDAQDRAFDMVLDGDWSDKDIWDTDISVELFEEDVK